MAEIKVTLSKRIRDIKRSPKNFVNNAMVLINQEVGKFLVGQSNNNKIPPGKDPNSLSGARLGKAPLAKTFQNYKRSNLGGFQAYDENYEKRKRKLKKKNWLTLTGEMFTDMVTNADVYATSKSVTIRAKDGKSARYIGAHFEGLGNIPKRNAYGAFNTADKKAIGILVQNRLVVAFGPKGGISGGVRRSRKPKGR